MIKVNLKVKLNMPKIRQLTKVQVTALEQTAEALHTEVVQAEIMPRDTGALQNESTFVDYSDSRQGKVRLVSAQPYARRLYFHPEYDFQTYENAFAQAYWYKPWIDGIYADFCHNTYKKLYRRLGGL